MNMPQYIVGLDFPIKELIELIDVASNGPKVVGLFGTGGLGKTTLSKAVYNKLVKNFQHRSFLSNVRETLSRPNGLLLLQEQLIKDLSINPVPPVDAKNAGAEIKSRLQENRVLVVIDDIDDVSQLNELGFRRQWLSDGSRIIISTRNKDALPDHFVDEVYTLRQLSNQDSLKLFSLYALRREEPTESYSALSTQIVEITGGLPLALQVFGSFLRDKRTIDSWRSALEKLQKIRPGDLQDILRISYDALDVDEKNAFLDIACMFLQLDMKREEVIDAMRSCDFGGETVLTTLVSRSLLRVVEEDRLWMHDQIRDMGRQIVLSEGFTDVGSRSRVWDRRDVLELLHSRKGQDSQQVQGIILDFEVKNQKQIQSAKMIATDQLQRAPNLAAAVAYTKEIFKKYSNTDAAGDGEVKFDTKSSESMINLRLLQMSNVKLEGSFEHIPNSIRWLQWRECSLESLSHDFLPTELRVLDISRSKIQRIWETKWFQTNKKVGKKLMVLNLYNCYNLKTLPDLSENKFLEKLILERCSSLNHIHDSVGDLNSLRYLNARKCPELLQLPKDVSGLKNLEVLDISDCLQIKSLPKNIECMVSLRELLVGGTSIQELPKTIYRLRKLERLSLDRCEFLKKLPECIGELCALTELSLYSSALVELPSSIGNLGNLETLNLNWCSSLHAIPESIGDLRSMANLWLAGTEVEVVPESVGTLYYLKQFSAGNCKNLRALPVSIEALSCMVELQLSGSGIDHLPDQIGSLKSLKRLELIDCQNLTSLPESIGKLLALQSLSLSKSCEIIELPESIGMLESLDILYLNHCAKLRELPASFGNLKNLRDLYMEHTSVTELPESLGSVSNLMILKMNKKPDTSRELEMSVSGGTVMPSSFANLSMLKEFSARAWRIQGKIQDDFEKLTSLEILDLSYNDISDLPSSLRGLLALKKLFLSHCKELKALPPLPSSLEELNVANCTSLESLSDLSNLLRLQQLHLTNCMKLQDIPGIESLKSLNKLHMAGCSPSASAVLQKLDKVALRKFRNLSMPGSEIPDWFTPDEVCYLKRKNQLLKSVIITAVVSINSQVPDNSRLQLPDIADVVANVVRLNQSIHTRTLDLTGAPNTQHDQLYLCHCSKHYPLVSILEDGDILQVTRRDPPIDKGVVLKKCGIHLVYENDDDYDGDEEWLDETQQSVSHRLTTFIGSSEQSRH